MRRLAHHISHSARRARPDRPGPPARNDRICEALR